MQRDMDLLLDTLSLPKAGAPELAEWDEAYGTVDNYFRACRVSSRLHRARLTAAVVHGAIRRRAAEAPTGEPLSSVAIKEARRLIDVWLSGLLPLRPDERPYSQAEGFVALYLCDGAVRWPHAFLNPEEAPPGFLDTLRSRLVKAGPDLEISSMVPRPLDRGIFPELADSARATFDRIPILRTLLFWIFFAAALVALFWYTRQ